MPALSLILCSRNDAYMGNARWRLTTALDYVGRRVQELRRESDVEIVVCDWGSEQPLSEVVALDPAAARITSFVHVPPGLARTLQGDSPFPEVLALNAAARRSTGSYIGRIDQDTLVGAGFLRFFFDLADGRRPAHEPPDRALWFSNQRMVPYRFAVYSPSLPVVERFVARFGRRLTMEYRNPRAVFYTSGVGIWMVHRTLWQECGGYDERMIYMNKMETNMIRRLQPRYPLVNLGPLVDYDFYHLEHYHPLAIRKSSTHRTVNAAPFESPDTIQPNGGSWGLEPYTLDTRRATASLPKTPMTSLTTESRLAWALGRLVVTGSCDRARRAAASVQRRVARDGGAGLHPAVDR